jgi:hypothetical protein
MTWEVRVFYRDSTCEVLTAADAEHIEDILARIVRRCADERLHAGSRYAWERAWIDSVTVLRDGDVAVTAKIENNDMAPVSERLQALDDKVVDR